MIRQRCFAAISLLLATACASSAPKAASVPTSATPATQGGASRDAAPRDAAARDATPRDATPRDAASRNTAAPTRGSMNVIIMAEIANSGATDALQAVKLLRPAMLRGRNGSLGENPNGLDIVVYVDGMRAGGQNALASVSAITIREIRLLNAADATTRFGTGHSLGAILVSTKQ